MKTLLKTTAILFLLLTSTSCFFDGVRGNGNVLTKTRKINDDFIRINASRGLDVYITKSRDLALVVEADENLHELIETEVVDGTLIITAKKNILQANAKKIHLSVDNVNEIQVSSGAEIYSENTFFSQELKVQASSGSVANLSVNVHELHCETSSGADVNLSGKAESFTASSSSGSDINAYDLHTLNCVASASSGSDIKVHVTDSFDASATSGADIKYSGNPGVVHRNNNSGGNIRHKNI